MKLLLKILGGSLIRFKITACLFVAELLCTCLHFERLRFKV